MQTITKKLYCDVAIIGGGTAGCSAAMTTTRMGLRTIIFEKGVSLGGLATNGYVPQIAGMCEGNGKIFASRLLAEGQLSNTATADNPKPHLIFDPEYAKFMLETLVTEHNGRVIYDATLIDVELEDSKVKCAVFYTKGGWIAVYAKIFIDSTGDADVCALAGVPFEVGGADFCGLNMSTTLGSRWAHYNMPKYLAANEAWMQEQEAAGIPAAERVCLFYKKESDAIAVGDLTRHFTKPTSRGMTQVRIPNTPDDNVEFCTFTFHSYYTNNTDVENITRQIVEQHHQMSMYEKFLRKYVPGYEQIHLIGTGSLPGVRDSRRIFGEYTLKAADIVCGTKFDDGIARFPEMLDTHHPTSPTVVFQRHAHIKTPTGTAIVGDNATCTMEMHPFGCPAGIVARPDPRDYCEIPYRCLVPIGVDNILTAGRCCSAEFHANGAMRIIGPAMGTGQAAGVAAYLSLRDRVIPRELDGRDVRKFMIEEEGVELDKLPDGYWSYLREKGGTPVVNSGDAITLV